MQKLTSVPNLDILSQKLVNPPLNEDLHFLIGIPFSISINPILTRADYAHHSITSPIGFLDLATALIGENALCFSLKTKFLEQYFMDICFYLSCVRHLFNSCKIEEAFCESAME